MRHLLILQTLLHLPSLLFLLLLAVVVFFLTVEEPFTPLNTESEATDIIWSRHTAQGEVVRMRAQHIEQRQNGIVNVRQVDIDSIIKGVRIHLHGEEGETDTHYQQIHLSVANGEILLPESGNVTLSLQTALYHLDGSRLQGNNARLLQPEGSLSGDYFIWNGEDIILRGNVVASYLSTAENSIL